jgi:hypothetical protein
MKGKITLILIVTGVIAACAFLGLSKDYRSIWTIWRIPLMELNFADLRNLTGGAESLAADYDPLYRNPGDPWGRRMNQPRLVQYIISGLKLDQSHTDFIGILFISLFLLGVFISFKAINIMTALLLAVVIFSPAVMLGVERGNHDLFIFFLVSLALSTSNFAIISMSILLFASFIKFYPVFALPYFLKYDRRRFWLMFLSFVGAFVLYLDINWPDLAQIFRTTQKGSGVLAYGSRSYFSIGLLPSFIPLATIMAGCLMLHVYKINSKGVSQDDVNYIDAFRVGAGIYVGTFFLGNNWAYRLMFLIFTIPQLVSWKDDPERRFISVLTLTGIIVSCWTIWFRGLIPRPVLSGIDEVFNWLIFSTLFYFLISTMPSWLRNYMVNSR